MLPTKPGTEPTFSPSGLSLALKESSAQRSASFLSFRIYALGTSEYLDTNVEDYCPERTSFQAQSIEPKTKREN